MAITLNSNALELNIARYMNLTNNRLNKSLERLSSGYKLNRAADGAAQMMLAETMKTQIRGYDAATTNLQQGLSMVETADSALQQINEHLQNIREIAVAAANGTNSSAQYTAYQASLTAELAAINSIASGSTYGDFNLLDGSISGGSAFNIQAGPNSGDTIDIKTAFSNNTTGASGLNITQTTLSTTANATTLLGQVDTAINTLTSNLATIGGFQNRLSDRMDYLSIAKTNVSASLSSIRDTDVAAESSNLARLQILQQAGAYALARVNTFPNIALSLLSG
ncbi:flagellin N-terminal helical domain-containing protein [Vampirovibrio chlorellavorus]|uniref:flagellin N-terminal helical domain-containing protein n=1 Tax=Vampirovibrio chlorellavorus TaxID=758823 RepID=UPI0026EFD7D8|nr:flagellin [Vampirovibrio chlorellavorus]